MFALDLSPGNLRKPPFFQYTIVVVYVGELDTVVIIVYYKHEISQKLGNIF